MGGPATVTWKGRRFDPRTRDMLVELERVTGLDIQPSQGSYNTSVAASGGTHAGGGAVDIRASNLTDAQEQQVVTWGRRIGFAMWLRRESKSWPRHIHGIAIGCPDLSEAAANQVAAYRQGRNGLADWGPDDGPSVPFTTWEKYRSSRGDELSAKAERKIDEIHDITVDKGYINTNLSGGFNRVLAKLETVHLAVQQTAKGGLNTRYMLAAQIAANAAALKAIEDGQTDLGEIEKACERAAEKAVRKVLGGLDEDGE